MAILRLSALVIVWGAMAALARAQTPSAIVEDISGSPAGVEFMDYVEPGRIIALGPKDSIVLSYLNSCWREVIHGGKVRVGVDRSEALTARVEGAKVDCEAGRMMRAGGQASDSASLIFRGEGARVLRTAPPPEFTLYGASPLLELEGAGRLVIARLDRDGEYLSFDVDPKRLRRGRFLDLAADGQTLTPGGVYGIRWKRRLTVFRIDPGARREAPIVGRLLRPSPAN